MLNGGVTVFFFFFFFIHLSYILSGNNWLLSDVIPYPQLFFLSLSFSSIFKVFFISLTVVLACGSKMSNK